MDYRYISGKVVPGLEIPQQRIMEKEPLAVGRVGSEDLIPFSKMLMKNRQTRLSGDLSLLPQRSCCPYWLHEGSVKT